MHERLIDSVISEMNALPVELVDHFRLTPHGWRSPTIGERGLQAMLTVQQTWAASLNNALQSLLN